MSNIQKQQRIKLDFVLKKKKLCCVIVNGYQTKNFQNFYFTNLWSLNYYLL